MTDTLNPQRIRYLAATLKHRSMRAAADSLNIAPSVISRQIALLEEEVGLTLLKKNGRNGVEGTEASAVLLEYFQEQQAGIVHALSRLEGLRDRMSTSVRVVATEGFLPCLTELCHELLPERSQSAVTLDFMGVTEVVRELVEGKANLGLAFASPSHSDLEILAHGHQPIHLIVPAGHELAQFEHVDFDMVSKFPLVLTSPHIGIRQLIRRVETYEKVSLRPILTTTALSMLVTLVLGGHGVTLLPVFAVAKEIKAGDLVAIPVENATFLASEAFVLAPKGVRLSRDAERVLAYFKRSLGIFS